MIALEQHRSTRQLVTQTDLVHSQSHWHFGMYLSHRKKKQTAIQTSSDADEADCSTETQEGVLVHISDPKSKPKCGYDTGRMSRDLQAIE